MPHQTGILAALKDWGLTVVEVPGWQTRGSSDFDPRGHVLHHDVVPDQPGDDDIVPPIILNGRPEDNLPGPLANFWLERDGNVHLVAAGRANHAGEGGWKGLSGNSTVWGTEMNNRGTPDDIWPEAQIDAAARLCAATAEFSGFTADMCPGHKEWAPGRKIDPHTIDMNAFRTQVRMTEKRPAAVPEEDEMILRVKGYEGHPPLFLGGLPHKVPGGFVDEYTKGRTSGVVDLPNNSDGRSHYDKVAKLVEAGN